MCNSWKEIWNVREKVYGFLAQSLLEPIGDKDSKAFTKNFWIEFPIKPANPQMESGLEQLIKCSALLEEIPKNEAIENVMVEYTALFIGPGIPKAPPWESLYRTTEKLLFGQTTYDIRKLLSMYGLESSMKNKQPEDHIGLELMFLSIVSNRLQKMDLPKQIFTINEQLSFINEHLLSWVHEICRDAKLYGNVGFYGGLIELVWGILLWDKELLEEFVISNNSNN